MKDFYLMRHGETLFNVRRKIQGWCDSPLTANGIKQAENVAHFFDNIKLTHLYSSTAERCCDTAEIVTRSRMNYSRLKGLRERNFGVFEGESEDLHPPIEARDAHYSLFGGETRQQVRERMVATCIEIMEKPNHESVLAVSHGASCWQFLSHWQDTTEEFARGFPNCCIFHYCYNNSAFKLLEVLRLN